MALLRTDPSRDASGHLEMPKLLVSRALGPRVLGCMKGCWISTQDASLQGEPGRSALVHQASLRGAEESHEGRRGI